MLLVAPVLADALGTAKKALFDLVVHQTTLSAGHASEAGFDGTAAIIRLIPWFVGPGLLGIGAFVGWAIIRGR